jgi:5-formyltetrahydrofolate cyclo-ligase
MQAAAETGDRMCDQTNDKSSVRSRLLGLRAERAAADRVAAGHALCRVVLNIREIAEARTVCCYVPIGGEPDTRPLLAALLQREVRVLLPVLLPDGDLDWGVYEGEQSLRSGPRGTYSPAGPRLGEDAIASADSVLLPGVAVDRRGVRLGRGGGSYDRALARLNLARSAPVRDTPAGRQRPFTAVLLYDGEILDGVPHEPHDQHVDAAITPTGIVRFAVPRAT